MPLYEYRCKQCGHQFEKIQSFSAPDEKECPVCKGEVERLISAPAIQFKGSGWYVTDYAGKSGAKTAPAASSGDSGGESKPAGSGTAAGTAASSTEAKPAAPSGPASTSTSTTKSD